jgi:hypothetical protein
LLIVVDDSDRDMSSSTPKPTAYMLPLFLEGKLSAYPRLRRLHQHPLHFIVTLIISVVNCFEIHHLSFFGVLPSSMLEFVVVSNTFGSGRTNIPGCHVYYPELLALPKKSHDHTFKLSLCNQFPVGYTRYARYAHEIVHRPKSS